jgi:hypothetical protein
VVELSLSEDDRVRALGTKANPNPPTPPTSNSSSATNSPAKVMKFQVELKLF